MFKQIEDAQSDLEDGQPVPPTKPIDEDAILASNLKQDLAFQNKTPSRLKNMSPSLNFRGTQDMRNSYEDMGVSQSNKSNFFGSRDEIKMD